MTALLLLLLALPAQAANRTTPVKGVPSVVAPIRVPSVPALVAAPPSVVQAGVAPAIAAPPVVRTAAAAQPVAAAALAASPIVAASQEAATAAQDPLAARVWSEAEKLGFETRREQDVPETSAPSESGLRPQSGDRGGDDVPPPPPPPSGPSDGHKGARRGFFMSLLMAQIGVEIMGLAIPQLANKLAGDFATAALLPAVSFAALTLGSLVGGPIVDRIGIRRAYLSALALRAAAGGALVSVYASGALTLPALMVLFGLDYFVLGGSRVVEAVTPTALYGSSQDKVQSFGTIAQMVIESMGIFGLTAGGALLVFSGFGAAMAAYPLMVTGAGLIAWKWLKVQRAATAPAARVPLLTQVKSVFAALRGAPALRRAMLGYGAEIVVGAWVYFSIAPAFGLFASRAGLVSPTLGTFLAEIVYASGGLLATILMDRLDARRPAAASPEENRSRLLGGTRRWLWAGSAALLGAFVLPFGATFAGLAAALAFFFAFGLSTTGMYVHLESLVKTEAPEAARGSVLGVGRALSLLVAAASFPALGALFHFFSEPVGAATLPTARGFWILSGLLAVLAALYAAVARGLKK